MDANNVIDLSSVALVLAAGLLGMYVHWLIIQKKGRKLVKLGFFSYLLARDGSKSGKTRLLVFAGAMYGLYSLGTFDLVNYQYFVAALKNGYLFKPALSGLATAIMAGYGCDSAASKGAPKKGADMDAVSDAQLSATGKGAE